MPSGCTFGISLIEPGGPLARAVGHWAQPVAPKHSAGLFDHRRRGRSIYVSNQAARSVGKPNWWKLIHRVSEHDDRNETLSDIGKANERRGWGDRLGCVSKDTRVCNEIPKQNRPSACRLE